MSNLLLGIDLGTSGIKTVITDYEGNELATAKEDYNIIAPQSGYAEQNMDDLWDATCRTIQKVLCQKNNISGNITGIGLSGQMHGLVVLDKEKNPLCNAIIWADQRSENEIEKIYAVLPKKEYQQATLNTIAPGFFAASLLWLKYNKPEIYAQIHTVLLPKDYIRFKLCQSIATEDTDASGTLLYNVREREWAWQIIDKLAINRNIFPLCATTCAIAGTVTKSAAERTHLKEGTPVTYGGGDQSMQMLGNGIIQEGDWVINIGTASQIACATNHPVYDSEFRTNTFCHADKKKWLLMGASLSGGIALKWLKNNILQNYSYRDFDNAAAEISAGSDGLFFFPSLSGERTPHNNPLARGAFVGLTLKHDYRHMVRSVMEGIIFNLRESGELMEKIGIPFPHRIIASGGGARSKVWLQIQADIFGVAIYTSKSREQACMGAAITAAIGTGVYSTLEAACEKMVQMNGTVINPIAENVQRYKEMFEQYKNSYMKVYGYMN